MRPKHAILLGYDPNLLGTFVYMELKSNAGRRQRLQKIMTLLTASDGIAVEEMCASFGISPSTIRRDLQSSSRTGLYAATKGERSPWSVILWGVFKRFVESEEKKRIGLARQK